MRRSPSRRPTPPGTGGGTAVPSCSRWGRGGTGRPPRARPVRRGDAGGRPEGAVAVAPQDAHVVGVEVGDGDVGHLGYFKLLKQMGYNAPISMHIEFDWTEKGKTKNREALVKALKDSAKVLRKWLAEA